MNKIKLTSGPHFAMFHKVLEKTMEGEFYPWTVPGEHYKLQYSTSARKGLKGGLVGGERVCWRGKGWEGRI